MRPMSGPKQARRLRRALVSIGRLTHDGAHSGVRFRDLRHTCGSQWVADGHDMFSVSRWLGHSKIAFTDRVYAHLAKEPDYTAAIEPTRRARGM
jgi:integrase